MQAAWNHTGVGLHPFKFIDGLGDFVNAELKDGGWSNLEISDLQVFVFSLVFPDPKLERIAEQKISKFLVEIAIGSIVAAFFNDKLEQNHSGKSKAEA
jgi:hypothetical protein